MTVNGFRKLSKNDESISLAKSLIKIWKKLLQGICVNLTLATSEYESLVA